MSHGRERALATPTAERCDSDRWEARGRLDGLGSRGAARVSAHHFGLLSAVILELIQILCEKHQWRKSTYNYSRV